MQKHLCKDYAVSFLVSWLFSIISKLYYKFHFEIHYCWRILHWISCLTKYWQQLCPRRSLISWKWSRKGILMGWPSWLLFGKFSCYEGCYWQKLSSRPQLIMCHLGCNELTHTVTNLWQLCQKRIVTPTNHTEMIHAVCDAFK